MIMLSLELIISTVKAFDFMSELKNANVHRLRKACVFSNRLVTELRENNLGGHCLLV
jgi:hypothetical protein